MDCRIVSGNEYGSVLVVSMDNRPLNQSWKILVQAGTQSRPTGWVEEPAQIRLDNGSMVDGYKVVSFGRAPWSVVKPNLTVEVNHPRITKVTALDLNGNGRNQVAFDRTTAGIRFRFPEDAMYVILEASSDRPAVTRTQTKRVRE